MAPSASRTSGAWNTTGWLQWGSNTNSVMERNIGQALGVGALFDAKTFESTVRLENLHQLESLAYRLRRRSGPTRSRRLTARVPSAGAASSIELRRLPRDLQDRWQDANYQLFSLDEVGTDPMTAINYERQVMLADGTILPFPAAALALVTKVKAKGYLERNLDDKTIALWEQRQIRPLPQWEPTFRAPLLDSDKWDDTRGRKVYRAKTLVGIWATAPFLHNGSVPTIFDLLRPAAERPVTFPTGQREYDPIKLGIQTDRSKYSLPPGMPGFLMDTRVARQLEHRSRMDLLPVAHR